ncbi:MAG: tripartite tricarboxylate transporter substrate binding protein [Pseudolabrys sp.]|jgi:tripartite-type tricarboxylate transporter receptor subunit TctC
MSKLSRRAFQAAAFAAAVALSGTALAADKYPDKPITMIIPLGAGGSHDLNARVMTSVLPQYLGEPVVVQLMPGGSGRIGTAAAAKAKPDGYTLLFTHNFFDELQQHVTKLPYDPNKDFVPVARTNYAPPSLVVRADSKFKTLKGMLAYAKAHPGKVKFGHSGNWGAAMVPGAALLQAAGVKMTLVPYKGGGPAMRGLLAGDVDFTIAFPSVITSQGDKVRTLVTLADKRVFKDVPTSGELGFPGVASMATMQRVVLAPAGIPKDRLAKLRKAFAEMSHDKTYKKLLVKLGENDEFMDGSKYETMRMQQDKAYAGLVKELTSK